jgi:predicted transcriptional regulator
MLSKTLLIFAVLCTAILIGCSKTETMENSNSTASNSNKTAASTPATTTASTGEKIGVPECDDFISKYDACVSSKVPEAARAQYKSAIDQWRASWKKLAENPATKGTLAAACKQAAEQQAAALKSYGCSW